MDNWPPWCYCLFLLVARLPVTCKWMFLLLVLFHRCVSSWCWESEEMDQCKLLNCFCRLQNILSRWAATLRNLTNIKWKQTTHLNFVCDNLQVKWGSRVVVVLFAARPRSGESRSWGSCWRTQIWGSKYYAGLPLTKTFLLDFHFFTEIWTLSVQVFMLSMWLVPYQQWIILVEMSRYLSSLPLFPRVCSV